VYLTQFEQLYATLVGEDAEPAGPTPGRDGGSVFSEEPNAAFNG